jgi:hypothetical protein
LTASTTGSTLAWPSMAPSRDLSVADSSATSDALWWAICACGGSLTGCQRRGDQADAVRGWVRSLRCCVLRHLREPLYLPRTCSKQQLCRGSFDKAMLIT